MTILDELRRQGRSMTEAFVCSFYFEFANFYIFGQIETVVAVITIFCIVLLNRFIKLSENFEEMKINDLLLKYKLQRFFEKQVEIWHFLKDINENFKDLLPLMYTFFMHICCILLYITIFVKVIPELKLYFHIGSPFFLSAVLSCCWALSYFTSSLYDDFASIYRLSPADLPLEFKLKMNCYMKRFGKIPLGISVGGFFYIKEDFFIKAYNALYSIFNTLIDLGGVMEKESKCTSHELNGSNGTNSSII
ncbi:uncharacterized protein [Centruroides vittatus]|uniref:uncharacterized protein n=1 Tax=Centruroides vittatus TaxID=120091 RepID=UPI00350F1602